MKAIHRFRAILTKYRNERRSKDVQSPSEQDDAQHAKTAEEIESLVERRRRYFSRHSRDDDHGDQPRAPPELITGKEALFLGVGTGAHGDFASNAPPVDVVSESPTNVDFDVYDRAYRVEVERIMANPARRPTLYLNRLVEEPRSEGKLAETLSASVAVSDGAPAVESVGQG